VITPQGAPLPDALHLPVLVDGSRVHVGIVVALVAVVVAAWLSRTGTGFRIDLVGANPSLAAQAGLRPQRLRIAVLMASAAVAGLAGTVQLFGLSHRLTTGLTGGVGFTGLLVAVLGRGRPIATAVAAVVFAALVTGGEALERDGVPRTLGAVLQGVLLIGVALATRTRT
jgi:simple sugar transport system permease protein